LSVYKNNFTVVSTVGKMSYEDNMRIQTLREIFYRKVLGLNNLK